MLQFHSPFPPPIPGYVLCPEWAFLCVRSLVVLNDALSSAQAPLVGQAFISKGILSWFWCHITHFCNMKFSEQLYLLYKHKCTLLILILKAKGLKILAKHVFIWKISEFFTAGLRAYTRHCECMTEIEVIPADGMVRRKGFASASNSTNLTQEVWMAIIVPHLR